MEKLIHVAGSVKDLRYTLIPNQNSVQHAAIFSIGDQTVKLIMHEPIILDLLDDAIIVGWLKDNIFNGIAYYNKSKKIIGRAPSDWSELLWIVFFFILGLIFTIFIVGLAFAACSIYWMRIYKRNQQANVAIQNLINIKD